jgi:hypothetical protein
MLGLQRFQTRPIQYGRPVFTCWVQLEIVQAASPRLIDAWRGVLRDTVHQVVAHVPIYTIRVVDHLVSHARNCP